MLQNPMEAAMPRTKYSVEQDLFPQAAPPGPSAPGGGGGYKEPGEFTRLMEMQATPQGLAAQPMATPQQRQSGGAATSAFRAPQPEPAAGAPPAAGGPSEFTKMFKAAPPAPAAPAPAPAVKKPPMRPPIPKKKTNTLLWVLIGVAVVLLIAFLLVLILK